MTVMNSASGGAEYRRYLVAITLFHQAAAESTGLAGTDFQASNLLSLDGPLTNSELARRLGLSTGATTRLVDRLVEAGIARRVVDTDDRRRTLVEASGVLPDGLEETLGTVRGPIGEALAALTPEQQEGVRAYLRAATDAYGTAARELRSDAD